MQRVSPIALAPLLLLAPVSAQANTVVSPTGLAAVEGNGANSFPFTNNTTAPTRRYMQIHSDLVGTPMVITKVACRMNGTLTLYTGNAVADMELYMGDSVPYNRPSFVFAGNYIGAPSLVMPRQNVNFTISASIIPAPFDFQMPLTTPYPYIGVNSLLWDAYVHSLTITATFPASMDVESASSTNLVAASNIVVGPGCTVAGQTAPMIMTVAGVDVPDTVGSTFAMGFTVDRGPANAPTLLAIGAQNLNLPVPGLCGNVYTDFLLLLVIGSTDATGFLGTFSNVGGTTKSPGGTATLAFPSAPGAVLFLQAHAVDFTQTNPIPVSNSDGRQITLPTTNPLRVRKLSRIFNNFGGVTQPNAIFFGATSLGYGCPTEFTY
jgi:hypothetical protein